MDSSAAFAASPATDSEGILGFEVKKHVCNYVCVDVWICQNLLRQFPTPLPTGLRQLGLQRDRQEREGPHGWAGWGVAMGTVAQGRGSS